MNGAGKTSIMEGINYCLYGAKQDEIFRNINRREKAKGNFNVSFELVIEMDDLSELIVKRSWSAGAVSDPKPRDLTERLVVVRDGKRVSVQNQEIWQDFIRPQSLRASRSSSFLTERKSGDCRGRPFGSPIKVIPGGGPRYSVYQPPRR